MALLLKGTASHDPLGVHLHVLLDGNMQGCLTVSIDSVRVCTQGEEALNALELAIDYSEVERGAIEDILVINIEAELPLCEHHQ